MAQVPRLEAETPTGATSQQPRTWKGKPSGNAHKVHAVDQDSNDPENEADDGDQHKEANAPEDLEAELEVLMTQAARKRSQLEKAPWILTARDGGAKAKKRRCLAVPAKPMAIPVMAIGTQIRSAPTTQGPEGRSLGPRRS